MALVLEANPRLTWRDLMYITVFSARPGAIQSETFFPNGRDLLVSNVYGYDLMDAGRMVGMARSWLNVPGMKTCRTSEDFKLITKG